MARLRRLAFLIVAVALGMLLAAPPGRAQEAGASRYAFADTTLLRDTLGLHFQRLFPLSDSLQVLPDTLRALSIRYLWSLERLVHLSDSLGVVVDSVGPTMERERFNPLASGTGTRNDFAYNSSYSIGQTQSAWRNSADYGLQRGPVFVRNSTTVEMDRYRAGNVTSLRQTRSSSTELGWRFSPNLSLGGRVNLERFDTRDPSSITNVGETKNEYQMSMRSRQRLLPGLSSDFNFFSGLLDLKNASLEKRGVSGNLNTRIRYSLGSWMTQELNGAMDGNLARTRVPSALNEESTRDFSQNVRGSVSLYQAAPISLKGNYSFRHVQVETPADSGSIRRVLSDNTGADVTVRLRQDNDRYLDLTQRTAVSKQATVLGARSRNTRQEDGFSASGRYLILGWALDTRFQNGFSNSAFPTRSDSGGYGEFLHIRSLDGTLNRSLTSHLNAKISASIGLTSYRYFLIGKYPSPPVSRDQWRQSWRAEASYSTSARFNTAVAMEVSKNRLINIPSASTGANNGTRSYRGEWRWSYRLLSGLTATQRNTLSADYLEYPFLPENNRLTLDYGAVTTLNAVITPRLTVNVTHNSRQTPGGNYTAYPDGFNYFSRADESKNYTLGADIAYAPSEAISFTFQPNYYAADRSGTVNGVAVPQRSNRSLTFSGGANINYPISQKGVLRGDIHRSYRAERSTSYSSGVPLFSPRSELDYWNGSLQVSWHI
jgi:hypothetical protein